MRELNIGEQIVRVKATPLALLFYKQEFKADLLGDLMKMQAMAKDPSNIDFISIMQLIWAMAKAAEGGKSFSSFYTWLEELESVDFSDESLMISAMEEAAEGFFRRKFQAEQSKRKGKR